MAVILLMPTMIAMVYAHVNPYLDNAIVILDMVVDHVITNVKLVFMVIIAIKVKKNAEAYPFELY